MNEPCVGCGSKIQQGHNFCANCGNRVQESSATHSAEVRQLESLHQQGPQSERLEWFQWLLCHLRQWRQWTWRGWTLLLTSAVIVVLIGYFIVLESINSRAETELESEWAMQTLQRDVTDDTRALLYGACWDNDTRMVLDNEVDGIPRTWSFRHNCRNDVDAWIAGTIHGREEDRENLRSALNTLCTIEKLAYELTASVEYSKGNFDYARDLMQSASQDCEVLTQRIVSLIANN